MPCTALANKAMGAAISLVKIWRPDPTFKFKTPSLLNRKPPIISSVIRENNCQVLSSFTKISNTFNLLSTASVITRKWVNNWAILQLITEAVAVTHLRDSLSLVYASPSRLRTTTHFNFGATAGRLLSGLLRVTRQLPTGNLKGLSQIYFFPKLPSANLNNFFLKTLRTLKFFKRTIFEKNNIWKEQYLKRHTQARVVFNCTSLTLLNIKLPPKHLYSSTSYLNRPEGLSTLILKNKHRAGRPFVPFKFQFTKISPSRPITSPLKLEKGAAFIFLESSSNAFNLTKRLVLSETTDALKINSVTATDLLLSVSKWTKLQLFFSALPLEFFLYSPFFLKINAPLLSTNPSFFRQQLIYYLSNTKAGVTNLVPVVQLKKYFIKRISSFSHLTHFRENLVTTWTYNFFIRFLEYCTGKKILLQTSSFINHCVPTEFAAIFKKWVPRMGFYEKRLGHKFFFEESLHILYLGFVLRDARLLNSWLKSLIQRISFWKTRLIFRFLKYLFQNYFTYLFPKLGIKGFKIKLKGKISAAGNSRKRTILYRKGQTSHSTVDIRVAHELGTINTFTGALGLQVWIFY